MKRLIISSLVLVTLFTSCIKFEDHPNGLGDQSGDKTYTCSAYHAAFFTEWLPYQLHETKKYIDASGNIMTITIDDEFFSEEREVYYNYNIDACQPKGAIYAFPASGASSAIYMEATHYSDNVSASETNVTVIFMHKKFHFRYQLGGNNDGALTIPEKANPDYFIEIQQHQNINGISYDLVLKATANSSANTLHKLYIAKGYGVIGFAKDSTEYWLQH